jgi:plasmid stability protein
MPAMTIRNISYEAHKALKQRAKLHGTSAEAEVRAMVEELVPVKPTKGLGTELREIAKEYGGWDLKIERDKTPARFATFE